MSMSPISLLYILFVLTCSTLACGTLHGKMVYSVGQMDDFETVSNLVYGMPGQEILARLNTTLICNEDKNGTLFFKTRGGVYVPSKNAVYLHSYNLYDDSWPSYWSYLDMTTFEQFCLSRNFPRKYFFTRKYAYDTELNIIYGMVFNPFVPFVQITAMDAKRFEPKVIAEPYALGEQFVPSDYFVHDQANRIIYSGALAGYIEDPGLFFSTDTRTGTTLRFVIPQKLNGKHAPIMTVYLDPITSALMAVVAIQDEGLTLARISLDSDSNTTIITPLSKPYNNFWDFSDYGGSMMFSDDKKLGYFLGLGFPSTSACSTSICLFEFDLKTGELLSATLWANQSDWTKNYIYIGSKS